MDNLDAIAKDAPQLKYVQIDDGYQPAMGDWLETGQAFGGDVQGVLQADPQAGLRAGDLGGAVHRRGRTRTSSSSTPTGSCKDDDGKPLPPTRSPSGLAARPLVRARRHAIPRCRSTWKSVFRTMRAEWGVTYFKLDANFWGAMHGGRLHDPKATRIEAYRRGMEAVLRGAGDSFILGCNHPDLAVVRPDPRLAQLGRHQAHLGRVPEDRAAEPESQLAERHALVERPRRRHAERRPARRGVPLPRHHGRRRRRPGALGRRPQHACRPTGWRC